MALPVLSMTVNDYPSGKDATFSKIVAYGTLGIAAGGLYQTNGLPLSFSGSEFAPIGTDGSEPVWAEFASPSSGIVYRFDPTYITLRIFVGGPAVSDPLAELASGASVTADTLNFKADFNKV